MTSIDAANLARLNKLADQQEIADVIYRYCRAVDRCDFEGIRNCYHPDAIDDHGDFRGGLDDFIDHVKKGLPTFERTMHFIGNLLVEPDGDYARVESYIIAHHHLPARGSQPERDFNVGLRYVDDFERREGEWRIAARVCAFEWSRIDPVAPGGWTPGGTSTTGKRDGTDAVYWKSIRDELV